MAISAPLLSQEHLTPHDLVNYYRCPREMEWSRLLSHHGNPSAPPVPPLPSDAYPLRSSPMFSPPVSGCSTYEGRPEFLNGEVLVYEDPGERDLPIVFPPESVRIDPALFAHGPNLIDREWELSGRPDLIVRGRDATPYPIEYKSTHLFVGYHESHGRLFDVIQSIAQCRLVHAVLGVRPTRGLVWYGDAAGEGDREGWVQVRYGDSEERWLSAALHQVRADHERPPVPSPSHCGFCPANRDAVCKVAAGPYSGPRR